MLNFMARNARSNVWGCLQGLKHSKLYWNSLIRLSLERNNANQPIEANSPVLLVISHLTAVSSNWANSNDKKAKTI